MPNFMPLFALDSGNGIGLTTYMRKHTCGTRDAQGVVDGIAKWNHTQVVIGPERAEQYMALRGDLDDSHVDFIVVIERENRDDVRAVNAAIDLGASLTVLCTGDTLTDARALNDVVQDVRVEHAKWLAAQA